MIALKRITLLVAALLVSATAGTAEDKVAEKDLPKALKPEVQTASWAVKWWKPRHEEKLKAKAAMNLPARSWIGTANAIMPAMNSSLSQEYPASRT